MVRGMAFSSAAAVQPGQAGSALRDLKLRGAVGITKPFSIDPVRARIPLQHGRYAALPGRAQRTPHRRRLAMMLNLYSHHFSGWTKAILSALMANLTTRTAG
jgi:hypothetical protein